MSFANELTFIPANEKNCEFSSFKKAIKIASKINKSIAKKCPDFYAKADPFHNAWSDNRTYLIEIVSYFGLTDDVFYNKKLEKEFFRKNNHIFKVCKSNNLVPLKTKYDRKKKIYQEYPTGGCHIHIGADLFPRGSNYFKLMQAFTTNLYTSYANNPWIKWLFAQYFDDNNSKILFTKTDLTYWKNSASPISPELCYDEGFWKTAIQLRMPKNYKRPYLTYEFRMVNMVLNTKELYDVTKFFKNWVDLMVKTTENGLSCFFPFTLKLEDFKKFKDLKYAEELMKKFIEEKLNLKWDDYKVFFNRNYVKRMKYGELI